MKELQEMCQGIANELKALWAADFSDEEREEMEENGEPCDIFEYLSDVLDFEYTIDSQKRYRSVKVWVALGGPNIWIDTSEGAVKGAWGGDRASAWLPREVCDEIDGHFEWLYND
jgi:hypothetical protein